MMEEDAYRNCIVTTRSDCESEEEEGSIDLQKTDDSEEEKKLLDLNSCTDLENLKCTFTYNEICKYTTHSYRRLYIIECLSSADLKDHEDIREFLQTLANKMAQTSDDDVNSDEGHAQVNTFKEKNYNIDISPKITKVEEEIKSSCHIKNNRKNKSQTNYLSTTSIEKNRKYRVSPDTSPKPNIKTSKLTTSEKIEIKTSKKRKSDAKENSTKRRRTNISEISQRLMENAEALMEHKNNEISPDNKLEVKGKKTRRDLNQTDKINDKDTQNKLKKTQVKSKLTKTSKKTQVKARSSSDTSDTSVEPKRKINLNGILKSSKKHDTTSSHDITYEKPKKRKLFSFDSYMVSPELDRACKYGQ